MNILCCPAVAVPEHTISMEDTLEMVDKLHSNHDQWQLVRRLITNTGVRKRHLVLPVEETMRHPGFEARNQIYERESKARVPAVINEALNNAQLTVSDIDAIIYVSCTGFLMPSPMAHQ